jgi:hypothetical protein
VRGRRGPGDERTQLGRVERLEARPQRDVRVLGHLRLHADEPLDHLERGLARAREQALPREQCAVQRAIGQGLRRHARTIRVRAGAALRRGTERLGRRRRPLRPLRQRADGLDGRRQGDEPGLQRLGGDDRAGDVVRRHWWRSSALREETEP